MIVKNLSKRDLCNLALASKIYNPLALDPSRWQQLIINQHNAEKLNKDGLGPLLTRSKRYTNLKSLAITKIEAKSKQKLVTEILNEVFWSKSLIELNFRDINLKRIRVEVLSKAIAKLKKVGLNRTRLTRDQLVAIFEGAIKSPSLTELNLRNNDLSELSEEDVYVEGYTEDVYVRGYRLGYAIRASKLTKVDLSNTNLSTEQIEGIVKKVAFSTQLTELNLGGNDFRDVSVGILFGHLRKAIGHLTKLSLNNSNLTTEQLTVIMKIFFTDRIKIGFEQIVSQIESVSLTDLSLGGNDLSEVPKEMLAKAITKLERVNLKGTSLTAQQLEVILEETVKSSSLVCLDLRDIEDLEEVPNELLGQAIPKLKKVNLFPN